MFFLCFSVLNMFIVYIVLGDVDGDGGGSFVGDGGEGGIAAGWGGYDTGYDGLHIICIITQFRVDLFIYVVFIGIMDMV